MLDRVLAVAWVFLASARMQLADLRSSQPALVVGVVQPVALTVVTVRSAGQLDPAAATRLAVGLMLTVLWASTVWNAGGILRREVWQGTLAANVVSVQPAYLVLLGKSLGATVGSAAAILVSTAATVAALGVPVRVGRPWWTAAALVVVVVSATALGMLLACLFLLTRYGPQLSSALMYPVFILGGLLVPAGLLPPGVDRLPALVSLHWAGRFLTGLPAGRIDGPAFAAMTGLTVAYVAVALWAFARVVDKARRRGTLELV